MEVEANGFFLASVQISHYRRPLVLHAGALRCSDGCVLISEEGKTMDWLHNRFLHGGSHSKLLSMVHFGRFVHLTLIITRAASSAFNLLLPYTHTLMESRQSDRCEKKQYPKTPESSAEVPHISFY